MSAAGDAAANDPIGEGSEIVSTRVFAAPRELVFRLWTDPKRLPRWWGPRGFETTIYEMDVRPGGAWRFTMHGPDGTDYINDSVYREIVENERIVYEHKSSPSFVATVTLEDAGAGKTRLTMRMRFASPELRKRVAEKFGAVEGLEQTLNRLGERIERQDEFDAEFVISRSFEAPRDRVFAVWTQAEHLAKWFGPRGFTTSAVSLELRPGGVFHYAMRSPQGQEMWGRWVFREIVAPQRLVFVSSFSDPAGGIARAPFFDVWPLETLSTVVFDERAGRTTLTLRAVPINATPEEFAAFRAQHQSMRGGWGGTLDQLAEYLTGH